MNSAVVRIFSIFAVLLAFLTSAASAEQNLYQQLAKMAWGVSVSKECRMYSSMPAPFEGAQARQDGSRIRH